DEDPYEAPVDRLNVNEFSAALETVQRHGFEFRLQGPMAAGPDVGQTWIVTTTDGRGSSHRVGAPDPILATVQSVVDALTRSTPVPTRGASAPFVVSFEGESVSDILAGPIAAPREDMLLWAKLEPDRFTHADTDTPKLKIGGVPSALLVFVHRAMVALQFRPALAVFEAVEQRGWDLLLTSQYQEPFICIIDTGTRTHSARYPTAGPACMKSYVEALRALN